MDTDTSAARETHRPQLTRTRVTIGQPVTAESLGRSLAGHIGRLVQIEGQWAKVDWIKPPLGEQTEWLPDLRVCSAPRGEPIHGHRVEPLRTREPNG